MTLSPYNILKKIIRHNLDGCATFFFGKEGYIADEFFCKTPSGVSRQLPL
jgi:hypothetical protein